MFMRASLLQQRTCLNKVCGQFKSVKKTYKMVLQLPVSVHTHLTLGFYDQTFENGWAQLNITTTKNTAYDDVHQTYATGYLEGYLTQKNIFDFYPNQYQVRAPTCNSHKVGLGIPKNWYSRQNVKLYVVQFGVDTRTNYCQSNKSILENCKTRTHSI